MNEAKQPGPTPDQAAAHEFLSELRTRISTQPLPYQYGVESRALESLWEVFEHARTAMKNHPGCAEFASRTTRMLNVDLRPVTAKWHRAHAEGRLKSHDGANEFRADLDAVQQKLRDFAAELHEMAYGVRRQDDLTPAPFDDAALAACLADLPFGIPKNALIEETIVAAINQKEGQAVDARRKEFGIAQDRTNAVGLGLSGGGIRSATFCLGVSQVLAHRDLFKYVDFLSTVSGGGYLGCFLTTRLDSKEAHSGVAAPHGPDPAPIRYLRQRAKYLDAANLKERWSMVTATFAGMILNWTAPLFLVALAALIAVAIPGGIIPWGGILLASGAVVLISLLTYAFRMRYAQRQGGLLLGAATAVTLLLAFLWLLTRAYDFVSSLKITLKWEITGAAIVAAGITAFPAIVRFIPILSKPTVRRVLLKVMLILAGLIIPIGAIAIAFWFYYIGTLPIDPAAPAWSPLHYTRGFNVLAALTLMFGIVAIFLLNINLTAPHRLYRDQLARTFIHRRDDKTERVPLAAINPKGFAPYHLINATANLPSSTNVALRERRSDFFLFSKHWCGAPSIGYAETSQWRAGSDPLDLATAMAVSGAAASSYMGLGSISSLSALLTFLNVRLGYWIRRPGTDGLFSAPGFACLIREMLGIAMSEKEAWINLSDGGHIENMAIYELLRRRCKFIVSIDGEADPQSMFHGHLTLVRHAQIDFGIRIEPDLTDLRPDLTSKFSQSHSMMCRVHYPKAGGQPAGMGLILYLKLSVTGNELELIKRYRALNPDFPHQTTLDQFFDEEQLEAYRQLGVHVAEGLFSPALVGSGPAPGTMKDWFKRLARNLLLPER
jgi:hypothetical protein